MAVSNRVRAALTTTVLATAATGFLAGCTAGGEDDEQVAYCTDENGEIVDDDLGWRLPVRGQRTKTNARTRKGPKRTVAGKKKVGK